MPRLQEHVRLTREFLGWDIPEVHAAMDAATRFLGGKHRVVGHDLRALRAMSELFGRRGLVIAAMHIFEDVGVIRRMPRAPCQRVPSQAGVGSCAPAAPLTPGDRVHPLWSAGESSP
jgi:hypothetical protein